MDPMQMLALATAVFLVTHYVSSTPLRSGLVAMLGENIYLGLYTLVSLATLGWMIWAYVKAPYERLWVGDEFKVWAVVLMPVSLVLIACGALIRNPSAVRQERAVRCGGGPPHGDALFPMRPTRGLFPSPSGGPNDLLNPPPAARLS